MKPLATIVTESRVEKYVMIKLLSSLVVGLSVGLLVGFVAAVLVIIPESDFRAV